MKTLNVSIHIKKKSISEQKKTLPLDSASTSKKKILNVKRISFL